MQQQIDPFFFQQEEEQDFNPKAILHKYLAYWKWFVLSLALSISAAFIYLSYKSPEYHIHSSVLIKDEKKGLGGGEDLLKQLDVFGSNKVVENEIEVLKSYTLMEKVVNDLHLNISYVVRKGLRKEYLYTESPVQLQLINANDIIYKEPLDVILLGNGKAELNGKPINLNKIEKTPYGLLLLRTTGKSANVKSLTIHVEPVNNVVEGYLENLTVETTSKMASVLVLGIDTPCPPKGEDLLNKLIEEYNLAAIADKNQVASITLQFIEERLKLISGDLSSVEKNVEDYKSREGITDISEEAKLFLGSVKDNDAQLNQVKIQQSVLNNIEAYVRSRDNSSGTVPATLGISDPTTLKLIDQLGELELKRKNSIKLVRIDNPIIIAIDEQIQSLKAGLKDNLQTLKASLQTTRVKLESENARMETIIRKVPRKERELIDITRQQEIKNNLYIFLLQKREETALSYASAVSDSRTIDAARSSSKPIKPVRRNIILLFGLIGIAIPFGIIYLIDLLNDKINNRKEIENKTQTPILGEISFAQHDDGEALIVSKHGRSALAEQIRALRTNLSFLSPGKKLKTIMFTSSTSGEGKSFISLNLGASLAMTGKRTIILEFDLRKPKIQQYLKISKSNGLSNFLIGQAELADIIHKVPGQENYFMISCGPIPPNPVELLINGRLEMLFEQLHKQFDFIIIDAPPVGLVTDAQILAEQADATLYVMRHDYTPKDRLKFIDNLYKEKRFKNLNLIFNGIKESAKYGYGYGYGYGYYEEQKEVSGVKLNGKKVREQV